MLVSGVVQATSFKTKLLRLFANASRLSIVETVRGGPQTVSHIVEATGPGQSNIQLDPAQTDVSAIRAAVEAAGVTVPAKYKAGEIERPQPLNSGFTILPNLLGLRLWLACASRQCEQMGLNPAFKRA